MWKIRFNVLRCLQRQAEIAFDTAENKPSQCW